MGQQEMPWSKFITSINPFSRGEPELFSVFLARPYMAAAYRQWGRPQQVHLGYKTVEHAGQFLPSSGPRRQADGRSAGPRDY